VRGLFCLFVTLIAVPSLAASSTGEAAAAREQAAGSADRAQTDVRLVEIVPDLPDFPNAVMASSSEKGPSDGWTHAWERETRTTASFDDVKTFYLEQIERKGWRITTRKEKAGKAEWGLSKGQNWGRVKLDGGSAGLVKITTEWKTR
jgi:hypothetical protein